MALFEDKKQLLMIVGAVVTGVGAAVVVGGVIQQRIAEETQRLAEQYQQAQQQREQQYNEQLSAMHQKIIEVEERTRQEVQNMAKEAAERSAAEAAARARAEAAAVVVKKTKTPLALKTPAGKRAITLDISSLGAVGGLINPGDFVDVIAHLDIPVSPSLVKDQPQGEKKKTVTAMIFQKLMILAINTNLDEPGAYDVQQQAPTLKITFAVDPQEAGLLSFAAKNGKFELALRGPNESANVMLSSATWSTLAEYVLENNGADLKLPQGLEGSESHGVTVETEDVEETKAYIPIYRGGKE